MAKIYTKTGDKGTTRLVDGSCVEKFNPRVEAYGTVDELNSYLGVLISELQQSETAQKWQNINKSLFYLQHCLFRAGSLLATEKEEVFLQLPQIEPSHIEFLEKKIDELSESLPALKQFILPSGHPASAKAHFARTLCRRAERRTAEVLSFENQKSPNTDPRLQPCLIFLNRLSDYLFVLARFINHTSLTPEVFWNKEPHE